MDDKTKRGRGRPKKIGSRHDICNVRLDEDEQYMIEYFVDREEKSKSDIVRAAIKLYYNINKNKYY